MSIQRRVLAAAVVLSVVLQSFADEKVGAYQAIVERHAQVLMEKATDRYGPVHSPLFAATLDLKTLSMPTESPVIPPGPRIREGDKCWRGCNPYLDTETIRAFYELSRRTADPRYREAAERYLSHFLDHCASPTTGLLPWGEHTFWNLTTDVVERDTHEFLVWLPLWPEMWDLNAPAVRRAIEGCYAHHVFDKTTGLFNRHASYSNARAVLGTTKGMPWIKHAGLLAYSLAFLYGKTGEPIYLERALQMANLYWKRRDPELGLPIGCIGHAEQPGSGGTAQCAALLAAFQVSGRSEFRDMAISYLSAAAKRVPKDPNAAANISWVISYGSDGGVFRDAQYMLQGYLATSDPEMLRVCECYARGAATNPPTAEASAEAYGRAIRFLAGLARATGKAEHRDLARSLADKAIDCLYDKPSGLFRGMVGYDYYDAQFGIGDLLMGLLELDECPYAPPASVLGVELGDAGVPSGMAKAPLRFAIVNAGPRPLSGTVRVEAPAGWRIEPDAMDFTVPPASAGGDVWLPDPGRTELTISVSAPATAKSMVAPVTFVLSAQGPNPAWEKRIASARTVFGEECVLSKPFSPDTQTVALAHFDKSADADHLAGVGWKPTGVEIVADGFFGGGAKMPDDKSCVHFTFPNGVPREGTIEFFVKPNWTSTRDKAPASDGVVRHIFASAPMTEQAMLWVYFLDELGAYAGVRVHGPHGKPSLMRSLDFKEGEWHHLAVCWRPRDGGGLMFAYFVDGVRAGQGALENQLPAAVAFQQELNVGSFPGCPTNGVVDELRVSSVARYDQGLMVLGLHREK